MISKTSQKPRTARVAATAMLGMAFLPTFGGRALAADRFRYVDREGRAHVVSVVADGDGVTPPPPLLALAMPDAEPTDANGVPYAEHVRQASVLYALPAALLVAVMRVESGFNPRAISSKGAMGLMQLMPATASDMGVVDPYDPRESVLGGARFIRFLMDQFGGDLASVLAAYHAGAGRIRRSGGAIPFDETRRYVSNVLRYYGEYIVSGVERARNPVSGNAHAGR